MGRPGIQLQSYGSLFLPPTRISKKEKRVKGSLNPTTRTAPGPTRVQASRSHERCAHSLFQKHQSWDVQWYISLPLCSLWNELFSSKLNAPPPCPPSILPCTNLGATIPIYIVPPPCVATCQSELHLSSGGWIKRRGKEESGRTSALIKNVWGGKEGVERGRERWR